MTKEETARRLALAVAEYNQNNPERPITADDIRAKRRDGWLGKVLLFCEGAWDGITDKVPEDVARMFRHGEIGNRPEDWTDRAIATQKQDQKARIPSYEEATGDANAAGWYDTGREIPTNIAAGLPGALVGAKFGGVVGGALGSAATTGAVYGSIAKDRFVEKMHEQFQQTHGRKPDRLEAATLNSAANEAANEYAREQALLEGGAQLITAIPGGYAARGAGLGAGRLLNRTGIADPAIVAGQTLARSGVRTAENVAGESISPERDFAAEEIFSGLNFLPYSSGMNRLRPNPLTEEPASIYNYNTPYLQKQR